MRQSVLRCGLAILVVSLGATAGHAQQPSFRGVWADAFHVGYKNTTQITELVNRCVQGRYNAIIVEVLAHMDQTGGGHGAYWNSSLVPKATDITGGIDPLAELWRERNAQGIEVHAWIYPYRACTVWPPSGNTRIPSNGDWLMVNYDKTGLGINPLETTSNKYWLDFGNPDCQDYIVSIVKELVTNYPIDGLHFDYEFSGGETNSGYPANINAYTNAKSGLSRYKRIYNTTTTPTNTGVVNWNNMPRRFGDELMKRCRVEIPAIRANPRQPVRFTASLMAYGSASADCNFASTTSYTYFSDWAKWLEQGWIDAAIPMVYKSLPCNEAQYEGWVNRSMSCWRQNRHVYIGLGIYLNSFADSITQMAYANSKGVDGLVTYSYYATRSNSDCSSSWSSDMNWYSYVSSNFFMQTVPTPSMPWRDPSVAVEGTVYGRITDASAAAVDDASVVINGQTLKTDANGYYVATMLPAIAGGTAYALAVSKTGLPAGGHPAVRAYAGDVARYDFKLGSAPATIVLNKTLLERTVVEGSELTPDTFTVSNTGAAALIYTVTDNASWLNVSPAEGVSTGQAATLTVNYSLAGLTPGKRAALISVTDPAASNAPQTISVSLTVKNAGVPGDFDGDGDVDMEDFGRFQACFSGSGVGLSSGCEWANFDLDNDVDSADFTIFKRCLTGPNWQGDKGCAD